MDSSYFEEIDADCKERIFKRKCALKKGISLKNLYQIEWLEYDYATLAVINMYYHHNIVDGKALFFQSSLCRKWRIEHYEEYKNQITEETVTTYSYPTLYYSILSGNKEHMLGRAELFGKYSHKEHDEYLANELLGYSLKYVILNDFDNAKKWLDELQKQKDKHGMKQLVDGHCRALKGLIEHNEEEFNSGVLTMLKNHVRRMKKEGEDLLQYFAYDSVAIVMLAKDRGINVTIKHELLPDEYFVNTDINYDSIKIW